MKDMRQVRRSPGLDLICATQSTTETACTSWIVESDKTLQAADLAAVRLGASEDLD